eukprot:CAMPEP_0195111216 /NCGR_PEP_ID=MMETSP0448-20130528/95291_1 /TAXON_ID=66468 /ORGANISM="Heterocapsa triquestra, Strain CCMP 448" /LENGTH=75 /DNA_ID=CAMNT_0040147979 /DNA_START=11 /DNA_END=235 /DNA_ORIENTATION=+
MTCECPSRQAARLSAWSLLSSRGVSSEMWEAAPGTRDGQKLAQTDHSTPKRTCATVRPKAGAPSLKSRPPMALYS